MLSLLKMTWMPDINIASGGGGGKKYIIFTGYCPYVPRVLARVVVVIKDYECVLCLWYNLYSCMLLKSLSLRTAENLQTQKFPLSETWTKWRLTTNGSLIDNMIWSFIDFIYIYINIIGIFLFFMIRVILDFSVKQQKKNLSVFGFYNPILDFETHPKFTYFRTYFSATTHKM